MKVLLLGFGKISYMPYLHFYLEQLKGHDIHLLYWDRDGRHDSPVPEGIVSYKLESYVEENYPLYKKVKSFLKYRKLAKSVIKQQKFDFIIVLHSTPGIMMVDILEKRFKGRYILDYRDFSHENINFYRRIVHKLVNNSAVTFVSSDAFRKFLPDTNKIHTSHNLLLNSLECRNIRRYSERNRNPIRIRYWGLIRHHDINITIINKLANDDRFELHYHGREQAEGRRMRQYCEDENIKNVFFHGEYKPDERYDFASETELIHNIYENDIRVINAMGNKVYDGIVFYLPQLCMEGSYMGDRVKKDKVGLTCDPDNESFADDIFEYYRSIGWSAFETNCDIALKHVMNEYKEATDIIDQILGGGRRNDV